MIAIVEDKEKAFADGNLLVSQRGANLSVLRKNAIDGVVGDSVIEAKHEKTQGTATDQQTRASRVIRIIAAKGKSTQKNEKEQGFVRRFAPERAKGIRSSHAHHTAPDGNSWVAHTRSQERHDPAREFLREKSAVNKEYRGRVAEIKFGKEASNPMALAA